MGRRGKPDQRRIPGMRLRFCCPPKSFPARLLPVPWKCPACTSNIAHSEADATPRPLVLYRCHICRLELVYDPALNKLVLAPLLEKS